MDATMRMMFHIEFSFLDYIFVCDVLLQTTWFADIEKLHVDCKISHSAMSASWVASGETQQLYRFCLSLVARRSVRQRAAICICKELFDRSPPPLFFETSFVFSRTSFMSF